MSVASSASPDRTRRLVYERRYKAKVGKTVLRDRNAQYRAGDVGRAVIVLRASRVRAAALAKQGRHVEPICATVEEVVEFLRTRPHVCEFPGCGITEEFLQTKTHRYKRRRLCIDHCHKTGKLRGYLCTHHNSIVGIVERGELDRSYQYLAQHLRPIADVISDGAT